MDALTTLSEEHRVIERGLDALERFASGIAAGDPADPLTLGSLVKFFREYADAFHHAKEEDILFRVMIEHGFGRGRGPVAMMLQEHEEGRAFVHRLAAVARKREWTADDRAEVVQCSAAFADLLRAHIEKEDNILYVMARTRLPPAVMAQVDAECARVRPAGSGPEFLDDLLRKAG